MRYKRELKQMTNFIFLLSSPIFMTFVKAENG